MQLLLLPAMLVILSIARTSVAMVGPGYLYLNVTDFRPGTFHANNGQYVSGTAGMMAQIPGAYKTLLFDQAQNSISVDFDIVREVVMIKVAILDTFGGGYIKSLAANIDNSQVAAFVVGSGIAGTDARVHVDDIPAIYASTGGYLAGHTFYCASGGPYAVYQLCREAGK